ncbi:MAG: LbtU family siderophore porin [Planctomycetaceae bacterium]|nr:LbtU family siderophore porin [Planctomycetaceae bacterium]
MSSSVGGIHETGYTAPYSGFTAPANGSGPNSIFSPGHSFTQVYDSGYCETNGMTAGCPSGRCGSQGYLSFDTSITEPLLDFQNRQSDKELLLVIPGSPCTTSPSVVVGGQMRVSGMAAAVTRPGKFSYLGRFPPDFTGNAATDFRMTQANAAGIVHFNTWAHGYAETLFSDVFTFPDFKQGSFQMRQAYVAFGDLTQSPWYAFIGKKNVSFGDMGTLSPYSQSVVWHYFAPLAEGAGIGYATDGFNASVTALNGSRGIRVVDSEQRGHINNFAANARYQWPVAPDSWIAIGGGYLHGTIYDAAIAEHLNPAVSGDMNGAVDFNLASKFGPWRIEYEMVTTMRSWPATDRRVVAYRAETAYDTIWNNHPLRISGSWSEGKQGPAGSQFEFNQQAVLGLRYDPHPNVMLSLEYIRSMGFAPLLDITTVSDRSAAQDTVLLGIVLNI